MLCTIILQFFQGNLISEHFCISKYLSLFYGQPMHRVYFVIIVHTGLSNPGDKKKRDLEIYVSFQCRLYDQTEGSESLVPRFHRRQATCKSARVSI